MSAPYIPLYIGDYLADTRHLSTEQHGAYILLLMCAWRGEGYLPNDEKKLARYAGLSVKKWQSISSDILEFFEIENDKIFQKRLLQEYIKYAKKVEVNSKNGSLGGRKKIEDNSDKLLKNNENDKANGINSLKQPEPEPKPELNIKEKTNKKDFVRGVSFKNLNLKTIPQDWLDYAIAKGLTVSQANAQFESFANYWISEGKTKKDWLATWRNRITSWIDTGKIKPQGEIPQTQIIQEISKAIQAADCGMRWNDARYGMTLNEARLLVNPKKCEAA